jgi:hypothetical protein
MIFKTGQVHGGRLDKVRVSDLYDSYDSYTVTLEHVEFKQLKLNFLGLDFCPTAFLAFTAAEMAH